MDLPVMPPIRPMLAKAVDGIPDGDLAFEPKWDGFRCIVFRDGDEIVLGSRNERPLTRYFPELIEPLKASLPARAVVDGEIIVRVDDRLGFDALQQRIHPAESRISRLAEETPAEFVAFDVLALADADLMTEPFRDRRGLLEAVAGGFGGGGPLAPPPPAPEVGRRRGRPRRRSTAEAPSAPGPPNAPATAPSGARRSRNGSVMRSASASASTSKA
ncbi:MAG: hypothetical protein OXC06_04990, partial [Acidimicrobiaceae bacterium]|nr:hypothetical protein [Acidimicrobiaceae bacterium]